MDLTDRQWTIIEPLFEEKRRPDGRGRPWRDARAVLNGVLRVLRTGAPWHDLPDRYPPYQTCHRRFQHRHGDEPTYTGDWRPAADRRTVCRHQSEICATPDAINNV
jgi:transposase